MMKRLFAMTVLLLASMPTMLVQAEPDAGARGRLGENVAMAEEPEKKSLTQRLNLGKRDKDSGSPLFIRSQTLTLDSKKRVFTYRGNVEITRDDLLITSEVMYGNYTEKNKIRDITCEGSVVITRGETLRASSERAFYDVARSTITLTDSPEVIQDSSALSADKITIYLDEDRSEAEGEVRVKIIKDDEAFNKKKAEKKKSTPSEQG